MRSDFSFKTRLNAVKNLLSLQLCSLLNVLKIFPSDSFVRFSERVDALVIIVQIFFKRTVLGVVPTKGQGDVTQPGERKSLFEC